jgi:SAM-dependent methyltransferase
LEVADVVAGPVMSLADSALRWAILASQYTPLRARGGYSSLPQDKQKTATGLDKAMVEAADYRRLFQFFPEANGPSLFAGKDVLDFGCGYGGRTVEYARSCGAKHVWGTEPLPALLEAGRELAAFWNVPNVRFDLCADRTIPYEDAKFDLVVTMDVLEHVADPAASLAEIRRVLKPGGRLYAVFPLYRGMFSHHLDYITLFPALHIIFNPHRIQRVVNELLDTRFSDLYVTRHPGTQRSYRGDRDVLPTLNGMGLNDFRSLLSGFDVELLRVESVADRAFGRNSLIARATRPLMSLPPVISEIFSFHVCCILRRPDA